MSDFPRLAPYRPPSRFRDSLLAYWALLVFLLMTAVVGLFLVLSWRHSPLVQMALLLVGFHVFLFVAIGAFRLGLRHARGRRKDEPSRAAPP